MELLQKTITSKTSLVSMMAVNNEIGVIQPLKEIGLYLYLLIIKLNLHLQASCVARTKFTSTPTLLKPSARSRWM